MKRFLLSLLFILSLFLSSAASATTYWVSPTGTPGASGADSTTNATTLSWFNSNAVQGDVCRFKTGTYTDNIWPGDGTSTSPRQNQLRYYGFPQSPSAVTVASIRLAGKAPSTSNPKAGDSCTVRWIKATGRIEGSPSYPGAGGSATVAVYDSIVKCSGTGNFEWGSQNSVYDSLTIALDGTGQELIDANTAGVAGTGLRPQNNAIKNSTFTATINRVGQQHVLVAAFGGFNTIYGNTFNLTMNSCTDYWFPLEFYHQSNNSIQSNTWNITMNATPAGTHAIWAYRDTATFGGTTSSNRFVNNVVNVTGTGTIDLGLSQAGSQSASTGGNYFGGNVISIQTPANGAFYWQNGARGDTVELNVVKTGTGGIHNVVMYNSSTAFQNTIIRHNTFYSSTGTVVDIGPSTPSTGSRFSSNIYYGKTANGVGSETVSLPAAMAVDSAGVIFNPGGSAASGFSIGGVGGTPGSGGSYGTAGKALWGSPRFTDSTYAGLNTTLLGGSYATGGSLQDGFAGATGTVTSVGHNEVVSVATTKQGNRTMISIKAFISGDDDTSAVCYLFYRRYGTAARFDSGMVLIRRVGSTLHSGMLINLTPATTYEFYVKVVDGATVTQTANDTCSTYSTQWTSLLGPDVYVSDRIGNDGTADGSPALPFKTIQPAINYLINLGAAGFGGRVVVASGKYYSQVSASYGLQMASVKNGVGLPPADQRWQLVGNPDSSLVLGDGLGAAKITGNPYDVSLAGWSAPSWSLVGNATYKTYFGHNGVGKDSLDALYGITGSERWHRANSRAEVWNNVGSTTGGTWTGGTIFGSYYVGNDTLYVHRKSGSAVTGSIAACWRANLLWIQEPYWRVANITFQYAGGDTVGHQGYMIRLGVGAPTGARGYNVNGLGNANATWIDSCTFSVSSNDCIVGTFLTDSVRVTNCLFIQRVKPMGYAATKGTHDENSAVTVGGNSWNIYNNTVLSATNGIDGVGNTPTDTSTASNLEITDNILGSTVGGVGLTDDAVEMDLNHGINIFIGRNSMLRSNNAVSLSPSWTGPVLVGWNKVYNSEEGAFKLGYGGTGSTGYALFFNNTVSSNKACKVINSPGGLWTRKYFRNNILIAGASGWIINGVGTGSTTYGGLTSADSLGYGRNDFNYSLMDTVATATFARWLVSGSLTSLTFAAMQNNLGWAKNSISGHAGFADSLTFAPTVGSLGINAGQRITGLVAPPSMVYYGSAPDIGAVEYNPSTGAKRRSWLYHFIHPGKN